MRWVPLQRGPRELPRRRQWHPTPVLLPGKSHAWRSLVGCRVAKSQTRLSDFTFTFHFHALEKQMATHSSVLAWRIPGTGEPGRLPSMGSHRVGHDWSNLAAENFLVLSTTFGHSNGEEGPHPTMRDLELGLLASKTLRNKFLLFIIYLVCGILHPECREINCWLLEVGVENLQANQHFLSNTKILRG